MQHTANLPHRRRGLTLMEVLVALTVFLLALVVLGRLVILGSDRASMPNTRFRPLTFARQSWPRSLRGRSLLHRSRTCLLKRMRTGAGPWTARRTIPVSGT